MERPGKATKVEILAEESSSDFARSVLTKKSASWLHERTLS